MNKFENNFGPIWLASSNKYLYAFISKKIKEVNTYCLEKKKTSQAEVKNKYFYSVNFNIGL